MITKLRIPTNENNQNSGEFIDGVTTQVSKLPVNHHKVGEKTSERPILKIILENLRKGEKIGLSGNDYEFSLCDGVIYRGPRLVIPSILRNRVLSEIHQAHTGIVRMKALAKSYVWRSRIDLVLEILVMKCQPCQSVQKNPKKVNMLH